MAEDEAATRSVKLKIHYTFDAEHKNDHLTKPPQSYDVQTAPIDETTTIGIIDLRTCLEAINGSSPEILSHFESDFTVYAYDYSEPNTPLVGQGLLSKIWTQNSPDVDNEAMVTGKVTKNPLGAFNKNAQPFLEVKLRLTPVASSNSRGRSGSVSSVSMEGLQQWQASQPVPDINRPQSPAGVERLEAMQRMLSEGGPRRDSMYGGDMSRPSSRPGTPNHQPPSYQFPPHQPPPQVQHTQSMQPRPIAQPNFVYPSQSQHSRRDSYSGYHSGDEFADDGPARKRAKIATVTKLTKTDFNIEQQPSSLRGAAIMSSSVRNHKPAAANPTIALQQGLSAEEPVRPPTPRPTKTGRPRGRPRKTPLDQSQQTRPSSPMLRPNTEAPVQSVEMSSPEETRDRIRNESTHSTPQDLPSSPPVMPEQQSFVTSPQLPNLPYHDDSGFMSGNFDDYFSNVQGMDFSEYLAEHAKPEGTNLDLNGDMNSQNPQNYPPVFDDESNFEGPTPQAEPSSIPTPSLQMSQHHFQHPPRDMSLPPHQSMTTNELHALEGNKANKIGAPTILPRPTTVSEIHRSHSMLPPVPASEPASRTFTRSNTWAPDMSDAIMSDAANPADPNKPRGRKRVGKEQTKARLETAIEKGEMPPFCSNCGTIETPAWRRGWTKIFTCAWDDIPESLEPGEMCYKEVVERWPDNSVKVWRGYKVERLQGDKDPAWAQICLCNSCGLYFHKTRKPRPPEKWQKNKDPKEKRKRKRPPKPPKSRTNPPRVAAGNMQSDAQDPPSEESSPAETSAEDGGADDGCDIFGGSNEEHDEPELPQMPMRPVSAAPTTRRFDAIRQEKLVTRAVQSSPAGTVQEPVDLDLTPNKPLRRVLFPSPRAPTESSNKLRPLEEQNNDTLLPSFVRRSPRINKTRNVFSETTTIAISVDGEGKENATPRPPTDGLDDLFDEDVTIMLPPATPTQKRRSERIKLKTPGREFGTEVSGNVPNSPTIRTPGTNFNFASIFLESAQKDLDPKMMTPLSRSLHEACSGRSRKTSRSKNGMTPKRNSPGGFIDFNFPDLPSLKDTSPTSSAAQVNFSELPTERLCSEYEDFVPTDMNMPSSPPNMNLADYFTNGEIDEQLDMGYWESLDAQLQQTPKKQTKNPDTLGLDVTPRSALRRSPRRHAS